MLSARLAASLLQGLQQQATAAAGAAWYATKVSGKGTSAKASDNLIPAKDWKAVKIPAQTADTVPVTKSPGQAFVGDMRYGVVEQTGVIQSHDGQLAAAASQPGPGRTIFATCSFPFMRN
jgi:hypothetical protein